MSAPVKAALRLLPPAGEDLSGPLGPGLLASGQLGTIIRELQAGLTDPDASARPAREALHVVDMSPSTTTLWRPVGQRELELVEATNWRGFPPRLSGQPIFYPVLNEAYATKIARDWNTKDPASGCVGHVLRFEVETDYLAQFPPRRVGGAGIDELWIPAERLAEFNGHIVGAIELTATYRGNAAQ
jgi:hypothetical protein